jgi:hypothetical protein
MKNIKDNFLNKFKKDNQINCKKRQALIQFLNIISNDEWKRKSNILYAFTMRAPDDKNRKIIKIGGTRNSCDDRMGSYLCGHHIKGRGKSGKASETNKYVYNTIYHYLRMGYKFELWRCVLPEIKINLPWNGSFIKRTPQYFHVYESKAIEIYKKLNNNNSPFFCDNSDPNERE